MRGLSAAEEKELIVSVGTHSGDRRLSPVEVAALIERALKAGENRDACEREVGLKPTQLSEFLRLLRLSPEIQHLADWGRGTSSTVPFSSLAQLVRLPASEQIRAAHAILEHRLSWKEVVQLVQIAVRSGKGADESIAAILKLRPVVERKYVFVGKIDDGALRQWIAGLSQRERDRLMAEATLALFGSNAEHKGRLGPASFTLVGEASATKWAGVTGDELERRVNSVLDERRSSWSTQST